MPSFDHTEPDVSLGRDQIADFSPSLPALMEEDVMARRLYNLHLMDYAVRKCEYRKHIVAYTPFICATSFTTSRYVMTESAIRSASW